MSIIRYEHSFTPNGLKTLESAEEHLRRVGSSTLQLEHLTLALSDRFKRSFSRIGADPEFFNRIFGVDPAAPRFSGQYNISSEVVEILSEARKPLGSKRSKPAGSVDILLAAIAHPSGRLRSYLMLAHMQSGGEFDESVPEQILEEIKNQQKPKSGLSIVA